MSESLCPLLQKSVSAKNMPVKPPYTKPTHPYTQTRARYPGITISSFPRNKAQLFK
ncbi:hypothetical protein EMPG_14671 [Blastomyces silverae]|uniref:Uncharacterized protein n=1 Tax=Blastomyces silverae TaxID=2060906 RepID=A0A0H1BFW2_9EURO|nr:hypothetical protein EMPG_14671 [Blastomyces silverae]